MDHRHQIGELPLRPNKRVKSDTRGETARGNRRYLEYLAAKWQKNVVVSWAVTVRKGSGLFY
jgi:hypothetical protein